MTLRMQSVCLTELEMEMLLFNDNRGFGGVSAEASRAWYTGRQKIRERLEILKKDNANARSNSVSDGGSRHGRPGNDGG